MANKPRLNGYALLGFLYHQNTQPMGAILHRTRRFHGFLLCCRYLKEFCRERRHEQLCLFVQDTWLSLIRMVKNCRIEFTFLDGKSVATLIRIADLEVIHLNLYCRSLTKEFTKGWVEICRALKDNQTLQRLEVCSQMPRESCNRFLVDHLPDKITKIFTDPEVCFTLGRRQNLEFMSCFVQQANLYYFRLLQIPTKSIEFFHDYDGGFWELSECGPLLLNPTLQKLKMHFRIGNFIEEYNEEEPSKSKFNDEFMPDYRKALKSICEVNPAIHLKLYDWNTYDQNKTIDQAVQQMHDFVRNAKVFIDLAWDCGVRSLSIRIQQQLMVGCKKKSSWDELNRRLADEFQMDKRGDHLVSFICHKECKIKLMQDTRALFLDESNQAGSMLDLINFEIE